MCCACLLRSICAGLLGHIAPVLTRNQILVSATKGLEEGSLLRMSQVIASLTENPVGVVSGPTFAAEVAAGIPTAMVAASGVPGVAMTIQKEFSSGRCGCIRMTMWRAWNWADR